MKKRTKVIEVDPRGLSPDAWGIGERPQRIAEGALSAVPSCSISSATATVEADRSDLGLAQG